MTFSAKRSLMIENMNKKYGILIFKLCSTRLFTRKESSKYLIIINIYPVMILVQVFINTHFRPQVAALGWWVSSCYSVGEPVKSSAGQKFPKPESRTILQYSTGAVTAQITSFLGRAEKRTLGHSSLSRLMI